MHRRIQRLSTKESCLTVHHAQVADKSPAFRNGHDQQRVSWLDKPSYVEAHM